KKYIEQSVSVKADNADKADKIDEASKNRLAEEVNILYVAITRAKSKLIMPPEINPLKSVEVAQVPMTLLPGRYRNPYLDDETDRYRRSKYQRDPYLDEEADRYVRSKYQRDPYSPYSRTSNHGKKWTQQEENLVEELYKQGRSLEEIAKQLH